MKILYDHDATIDRCRALARNERSLCIDDLTIVSDRFDEGALSTLTSTYERGTNFYEAYLLAQENGPDRQLTARNISNRSGGIDPSVVRGYLTGTIPDVAVQIAEAQREGVLPFGPSHPHYNDYNLLFGLGTWTGNSSKTQLNLSPCPFYAEALSKVVDNLGLVDSNTHPSDGVTTYTFTSRAFNLNSSRVARMMGVLGLPQGQGWKAHQVGLEIPWYARFMFDQILDEGRTIWSDHGHVERFRMMYISALLANKSFGRKSEISIQLMGTKTKKLGERLTAQVSRMISKATGGMRILKRSRMTIQKFMRRGEPSDTFQNRIFLTQKQSQRLFDLLERHSDCSFTGHEPYIDRVRTMAGNVLLQYVS